MITLLLYMLSFTINAEVKDWHSVPEYNEKHACYRDLILHCNKKPAPTKENEYLCLNMKLSDLRTSCRAFVVENLSHLPCTKDIQKLCHGPKQNLKNSLKCLSYQTGSLSKSCREKIQAEQEMMKMKKKAEEVCAEKNASLCSGEKITPLSRCLVKAFREEKLNDECGEVLQKAYPRLKKK